MQTETTNRLFEFDNTYARELGRLAVERQPDMVPAPRLLAFNRSLAARLGLDVDALGSGDRAELFAGNRTPAGAEPIAQGYAGHQFGAYNPQLGDGRALLLGEIVAPDGARFDVALKGSGRTPFSRGGDGKAAVGPVLREYLMGEAMHALGVPTTRALAAVATGETVWRDRPLPGAVLTRIAASHLRVGTFQFAANRGTRTDLEQLLGYALRRHDPAGLDVANRALTLLEGVVARQASLVAQWMHLGFIHGVMNTDNTTISGETIDYGPCAFMEAHDPAVVFSSIDHGGRYAYGNQPSIAAWNLARLAETLLPLIADEVDRAVEQATEVVTTYRNRYEAAWLSIARNKLGLDHSPGDTDGDRQLGLDFLDLLRTGSVDHTLGWRRLADAASGDGQPLRDLFDEPAAVDAWIERWSTRGRRLGVTPQQRAAEMRAISPIYVPRNELVEHALAAAVDHDDLTAFEDLLRVVTDPFEERPADESFARPSSGRFTASYRTFCGT